VVPLDYQVLEPQLVIDRLLIDELLHQAVILLESRLEVAVSVRFHLPSTALPLPVHEILREAHVVVHGILLQDIIVGYLPAQPAISLSGRELGRGPLVNDML
jgi:hypothetical protein